MTQVIAKYAARKMLSSEMNKYKDKKPAGQYVSPRLWNSCPINVD